MEYSSEVRRRFQAPTRAGTIAPDEGEVFSGAAEDRSQNLWVRFQVQVSESTIERVRFNAYGCPHSVAAADLAAAGLEGQPVAALGSVDLEALARKLDLPREKFGRLLRIDDALRACRDEIVAQD